MIPLVDGVNHDGTSCVSWEFSRKSKGPEEAAYRVVTENCSFKKVR
jgi:hypothetical protein